MIRAHGGGTTSPRRASPIGGGIAGPDVHRDRRLAFPDVVVEHVKVDPVIRQPWIPWVGLDDIPDDRGQVDVEAPTGLPDPGDVEEPERDERSDAHPGMAEDRHEEGRAARPDDPVRAADKAELLDEGQLREVLADESGGRQPVLDLPSIHEATVL